MRNYNAITSKFTYRSIIYVLTLISFIAIFLFLAFFAMYAPGNYLQNQNNKKSMLDIIFAIILLLNNICVILSFIEFVKSCYFVYRKRQLTLKQCGTIIVGIYPIILIFLLCDWKIPLLYHYLLAPVQILLRK